LPLDNSGQLILLLFQVDIVRLPQIPFIQNLTAKLNFAPVWKVAKIRARATVAARFTAMSMENRSSSALHRTGRAVVEISTEINPEFIQMLRIFYHGLNSMFRVILSYK